MREAFYFRQDYEFGKGGSVTASWEVYVTFLSVLSKKYKFVIERSHLAGLGSTGNNQVT